MPFIGAAITAIGTAFSAGGVFAAGGALSLVGKLLTTVAVSALSRALADKPTMPGIRNERTQAGGINPASFILGRYATGGTAVCPEMSYGILNAFGGQPETPNEFLVYVIDLGDIAGGDGLHSVIIDGVAVTLGAVPEDLPAIPIYATVTDPETGLPTQVQTGTIPAVSKGLPGTGDYAGNLWVKFKDGTDAVADPYLRRVFGDYPERPWTEDMIGTGVPHVIVTFRRNPNLYRGFPRCRFVVGGIPLYDWRKDSSAGGVGSHRWDDPATWEPSENAIVQVYNILRGIRLSGGFVWGGRAPASALRSAEWTLAANTADAGVALSGGGFEPAARASYEVTVADEAATIIEDILRGCNGQIADMGGAWRIRISAPALPVWHFSDEDVIVSSPQDLTPFPPQANTYNAVTAVFPDPEMNWEPTEAPARYNATWEALDGDRRLPADLSLPATPYPNQVQRVMRAYIEAERRFTSIILTLPPEAAQYEPLDTLSWTSTSNGYAAKGFEVAEVVVDLIGGNAQVSLREIDPGDYGWEPGFEMPFNRPSSSIVARVAAQVSGAAASAITLVDATSAARRPAIRIVWTAAQATMYRGLQWELRVAGATEVRNGSTQAIEAGELTIADGILPATDYQIRLSWIADQEVAWTPWLAVTTPDVRLGAADIDATITDAIAQAHEDIADAQALLASEIDGRARADLIVGRNLDQISARVTSLLVRLSNTQALIADAGIYVDPESASVRIAAVSRLDGELTETRIALDAMAGTISLLATRAYVDGVVSEALLDPEAIPIIDDFNVRLTAAEVLLDGVDARIDLKADALDVDGQGARLTSAEANIDGLNAAVSLKASSTDLGLVEGRVSTVETELSALDGASFSTTLVDTRRLSRASTEHALRNLGDLLRAWREGEVLREDIAYVAQDLRALVSEDRVAIAQQRVELGVQIDTNRAKAVDDLAVLADETQAIAGRTTALEATSDGLTASVETQGTAIATLEGNAAASYVIRARAGGAVGEVEVVAGSDPEGESSAVIIRSDRFRFEGDLAEFLGAVKVDTLQIADNAVTIPQSVYQEAPRDVTSEATEITLLTMRVNKVEYVVDLSFGLTLAGIGGGGGVMLRIYRDSAMIRQIPVNTGQDGRRQSTTILNRDASSTYGFKNYSIRAVKIPPAENVGWDKSVRVSRTLLTANQFRK